MSLVREVILESQGIGFSIFMIALQVRIITLLQVVAVVVAVVVRVSRPHALLAVVALLAVAAVVAEVVLQQQEMTTTMTSIH